MGARPSAVRRRLGRQVRLRHPRPDQTHSRRTGPGPAYRQDGARPHRTISSPRPSRSRSARKTSCRASTSPTTRCCRAATSRISTRSLSGWAAPTSPHRRSTRRNARSTRAAGRPHDDGQSQGPGELRAQLLGRRTARAPRARHHQLSRGDCEPAVPAYPGLAEFTAAAGAVLAATEFTTPAGPRQARPRRRVRQVRLRRHGADQRRRGRHRRDRPALLWKVPRRSAASSTSRCCC